jgi:hypothetical protein
MGSNRRRLPDDELQHYEDNIAFLNHVIHFCEWLFHVVTFHIMDRDVREITEADITETRDRAIMARDRNISRMRKRKREAKRARREKREARDI